MTLMERILLELVNASTWLSTAQLTTRLGGKRSSIGRALRRLWFRNKVAKSEVPDDEYGNMQWLEADKVASGLSFPDAPPAYRPIKVGKPKLKIVINNPTASTQGDLIMQIEQAVKIVLQELTSTEKEFSAYDVTQEIRNRVNAGTIAVDPSLAGTTAAAAGSVTDIRHNLVRDAVHALMSNDTKYEKNFNCAGFYEYVPIKQAVSDPNAGTAPTLAADASTYDGKPSL